MNYEWKQNRPEIRGGTAVFNIIQQLTLRDGGWRLESASSRFFLHFPNAETYS